MLCADCTYREWAERLYWCVMRLVYDDGDRIVMCVMCDHLASQCVCDVRVVVVFDLKLLLRKTNNPIQMRETWTDAYKVRQMQRLNRYSSTCCRWVIDACTTHTHTHKAGRRLPSHSHTSHIHRQTDAHSEIFQNICLIVTNHGHTHRRPLTKWNRTEKLSSPIFSIPCGPHPYMYYTLWMCICVFGTFINK